MIKKYWILLFIISLYIGLLVLYFCNFNLQLSESNEKWGTFGDFFGGTLSPIIGIVTIYLTYNIIYDQIRENKQSEFKYIFQLLFDKVELKREAIHWNQNKKEFHGLKAISRINNDIEVLYISLKNNNPNEENIKLFENAFWSVFDDINGSSSPYMKVIHNCLKTIDNNCLEERKEQYSSILRAQLNSDELIFIFYNAISSKDFKSFKQRIEKFSILKDVAYYNFPTELKSLFNEIAFTETEITREIYNLKNKIFELGKKMGIMKINGMKPMREHSCSKQSGSPRNENTL